MCFKKQLLVVFLFLTTLFYAQNDCVDALIVCGNTGFEGLNATGIGIQELNNSNTCGSMETNSIWLKLSINTGGTLGFTLIPESTNITIDFDFFIFGPNVICGNIGQAIRCSTTNPQAAGSSSNLTGLSENETDTAEGPGNDGNNFVKWLTVNDGETYFLVIDRPIGASNFSLTWNGTATFNQAPSFQLPNGVALDIESCDNDAIDDDRTSFDLEQNSPIIIGTQSNVGVTYHTSINDALIGINAIINSSNFNNTSNPQTLVARITNSITGCFETSEFQIEVIDAITIPGDRFEICDDASDGNDSNGRNIFDLDEVTVAILPNIDLTGTTIAYYSSFLNALNNNSPLPNPFYNNIPNEETVFVKVTNVSGCSKIKDIALIVNPLPTIVTTTLIQCDEGLNPDGITVFNLNEAISSLTNDDANLIVSFFYNGIAISATYTNLSNPQQIQALITNSTTNCSSLSTVNLSVNVINQQISIPSQCDILDVEDGFRVFDLTTSTLVLNPTESVVFYESLNDALLEINPIPDADSYTNLIPYDFTVYARVEDGNNCSGISELQLIVTKLPVINRMGDGNDYLCSNIPEEPIILDASILEGIPSDYTYEWFLNGDSLNVNTYSIAVNTKGTYTVNVTNSNGCSVTRTIVVQESSNAIIENLIIQDATLSNNTVTIILDSNSIGNYQFSLDYIEGSYQSSNFFSGITSGFHTVFIRDVNGCGVISYNFYIIGAPQFFTPNGDGFNDYWRIDGISSQNQSSSETFIYNRYGQLIKYLPGSSIGWDGTFNGNLLKADDYWYVSKLEDGRMIKGHFTLKR